MATSNDGSNQGAGKGPAKPGTESGPKKPSAIIDLKPSGVAIRDPKAGQGATTGATPEPAKPQAAGGADSRAASAVAGAAAAAATSPGAAASGNPTAGAGPSSADTATPSASAKPATPAGTSASSTSSAPLPRPAASGGIRSAATHLVAGLAGGLLALLGADALSQAGLLPVMSAGSDSKALQAIESRLASIEARAKQPAGASAQALTTLEQRLAEIERAAAQVREGQAKLVADTRQIGEQLAAQPRSADADRLAKMEEMLAAISAAARDPQAGRIPQLAAITSKLTDLEASVATQIAAMRKGVTQEVDSRLAQSAEAAQTARAGTQRLDRELAGLKAEAAQAAQRLDQLKAQTDRVEVAVRALRDEASQLKAEVGGVQEVVRRELAQVAPINTKLSLLEQNVQGVVRSEDDRRANVERIVVALELGNLKRTVDRGAPFAKELAEVRRLVGTRVDLSALDKFRNDGVASSVDLEREFRSLAFRIVEADGQPADAHWTERLLSSAKSIVRVRRVEPAGDDKSVDAIVLRMEQALKAGRLVEVTAEAAKLSDKARAPAAQWLERVAARAAVERAIAAIEQDLKASLSPQTPAAKKG